MQSSQWSCPSFRIDPTEVWPQFSQKGLSVRIPHLAHAGRGVLFRRDGLVQSVHVSPYTLMQLSGTGIFVLVGTVGISILYDPTFAVAVFPSKTHLSGRAICKHRPHAPHSIFTLGRLTLIPSHTAADMPFTSLMGWDLGCSEFGSNPVKLGKADVGRPGVPSIVHADNGTIKMTSVLSTIHNCVFDESGKLERISLNLLGMFSAAFTVITGVSHPIIDRRLVVKKNACLHTKRKCPRNQKACVSIYHSLGAGGLLDPRSRVPICTRCYDYERNIAHATCPTVEVLLTRVHRDLMVQIELFLMKRSCLQWLMAMISDFPNHHLQLCKHRKTEGAVYRAVCPSASILFRMARSPRADEFDTAMTSLVTIGWVEMENVGITSNAGYYVYNNSILVLADFARLVTAVEEQSELVLKLVPRFTIFPLWMGPCHEFDWNSLIAAVRTGKPLYGARVNTPQSPFEVLISLSTYLPSITLAPIGPEHSSDTIDPNERAQLIAEAASPWQHVPFSESVWNRVRPDWSSEGPGRRPYSGRVRGNRQSKRRRLQDISEEDSECADSQPASVSTTTGKKSRQCASVHSPAETTLRGGKRGKQRAEDPNEQCK